MTSKIAKARLKSSLSNPSERRTKPLPALKVRLKVVLEAIEATITVTTTETTVVQLQRIAAQNTVLPDGVGTVRRVTVNQNRKDLLTAAESL
jgi:hypothetical protein